ncbi:MAG: hypothetical protein Q8R02_16580 [Hyphomonadaceae bacterium]|nr:hypothetical protein [Hyphomonadaceae bacterium]
MGDFTIEMFVGMNERPTERMAVIASTLVDQFRKDEAVIAQLVYDEYVAMCSSPHLRDRLASNGVEPDLPIGAIGKYLDPRILEVADDGRALVYIGPDWDRELGLCIEHKGGGWAKTDP